MEDQFSYSLEFDVIPVEFAPEIPEARGNKESPLRTALKELPRGGFVFVKGRNDRTRKRVSDMCSRIRRLSKHVKAFSIRSYEANGEVGIGVWRTDVAPVDTRLARPVVNNQGVPWPSKEQKMAGK